MIQKAPKLHPRISLIGSTLLISLVTACGGSKTVSVDEYDQLSSQDNGSDAGGLQTATEQSQAGASGSTDYTTVSNASGNISAPAVPEPNIGSALPADTGPESLTSGDTGSQPDPVEDPVIVFPTDEVALVIEENPTMFKWNIAAAALSSVTGFEIIVNDGVNAAEQFRDNTIPASVCSDRGECSFPIALNALQLQNPEFVWSIRTVMDNDQILTAEARIPVEQQETVIAPVVNLENAIYVSADGNDGNTGDTPSKALRSIQNAVDLAEAGDTVFIKAGNYGNENIRVTKSGSTDKPIVLEGYQARPGDRPMIDGFNHQSSLDSSKMPLLDGGSRANTGMGIFVSGDNVEIRNIQLTNYKIGLYAERVDNILVDHVIATDLGNPNKNYDGHGINVVGGSTNSTVSNNTVVNATAQAISFEGENSVLEGNAVYADETNYGLDGNTNYYFILYDANNNTIRNNHIERVGELTHLGHGYTVKKAGENNIFENNSATNILGGAIVARHSRVKNNVYRNNYVNGGVGLFVKDGAQNNLFKDNIVENAYRGIVFGNYGEDDYNTNNMGGSNNTFDGNTLRNIDEAAIFFWEWGSIPSHAANNIFNNITIEGANYLFGNSSQTSGNIFRNSNVSDVPNWAVSISPYGDGDLSVSLENNTFSNTGF